MYLLLNKHTLHSLFWQIVCVWPLFLLLFLTLGSFWFIQQERQTNTFNSVKVTEQPDGFIKNATIHSMDKNGKLQYYLQSEHAYYNLQQHATWLEHPHILLYPKQGSPWKIQADKGWVNKNAEKILFQGETHIKRDQSTQNQAVHIATSDLLIMPKIQIAETSKAITLTTAQIQAQSIGMQANLKTSQYHLLSHTRSRYVFTQP